MRRSGGVGRIAAAVLGVVLVLGGVGFAVARAGDRGPGTPEAAVEALLRAAADGDAIGVLEVLPAGERRALMDPARDITAELVRLGVLDGSFDLGGIPGFELEIHDLELRPQEVQPGVVAVEVTGGTASGRILPDDVPIGPVAREVIEDLTGEPLVVPEASGSGPLVEPDDEMVLVAIEDGGGWRVSMGYSIAENIRREEGLPLPDPAQAIEARGASSPEAAVEELVRAAFDLDLRRVLELLPPDEMAALHAYAPLFLDDVLDERDRLQASGDIPELLDLDLRLSSDGSGSAARVRVDAVEATVRVDGDRFTVAFDGDCLVVEDEFEREELGCLSDLERELADLPVSLDLDLMAVLGATAVRVDGAWFVSPIRTYLDSFTEILRALPDDAVRSIVELVEEGLEGFFEEVDVSFDEDGFGFEVFGGGISGPIGEPDDLPVPPPGPPPGQVPNEPSVGGLVGSVLMAGVAPGDARCVAEGIHELGLTDEELAALEVSFWDGLFFLDDVLVDEALAVVDRCEEPD